MKSFQLDFSRPLLAIAAAFLPIPMAVLAIAGESAAAQAQASQIEQLPHISVERSGTGSPVILIPGLSMSRESWRDTAQMLAADHEVHLVQINGFGGTPAGLNAGAGLLAGVAQDLASYLRQHQLEKVPLVGHSLGGALGLVVSRDAPELVGRLLIVDALPWLGLAMVPPEMVPAQIEPQAAALRDALMSRHGQPFDPARHAAETAGFASRAQDQELVGQWSAEADPRVTAWAFYEDMMLDLRPDMAAINAPVTVIYPLAGTPEERARSSALYRSAFSEVRNSVMVPIEDSRHFVMLDQPMAFAVALKEFLQVW